MRALDGDHRLQRIPVQHVDHVRAVRHLHGRRIRVAVDRNDLHAKALGLDGHFLAEFARTQQHQAGGVGGERCSQNRRRSALR